MSDTDLRKWCLQLFLICFLICLVDDFQVGLHLARFCFLKIKFFLLGSKTCNTRYKGGRKSGQNMKALVSWTVCQIFGYFLRYMLDALTKGEIFKIRLLNNGGGGHVVSPLMSVVVTPFPHVHLFLSSLTPRSSLWQAQQVAFVVWMESEGSRTPSLLCSDWQQQQSAMVIPQWCQCAREAPVSHLMFSSQTVFTNAAFSLKTLEGFEKCEIKKLKHEPRCMIGRILPK